MEALAVGHCLALPVPFSRPLCTSCKWTSVQPLENSQRKEMKRPLSMVAVNGSLVPDFANLGVSAVLKATLIFSTSPRSSPA